jgi:hypothetical protein
LICSILGLGFTLALYFISENEDEVKQKILEEQLSIRDSIHAFREKESSEAFVSKLDSSKQSTIKLLAEYKLQIDSANNRIVKTFRDSSKTTIISTADPDLDICGDPGIKLSSHVNEAYEFNITVCNNFAPAENVYLKYHVVSKDKFNNFYYEDSALLMNGSIRMSAASGLTFNKKVQTSKMPIAVYFVFRGSYYNSLKKRFKISTIHSYDLIQKSFGGITPNNYGRVMEVLKSQSIK